MNYYSIGEFANKLNVTTQTLRNWDKEGKLKPHHISDCKHEYYSEEQLHHILGLPFKKEKKIKELTKDD